MPILHADLWRRLSGVVMMQGVIYFRMFHNDNRGIKLIVCAFCSSLGGCERTGLQVLALLLLDMLHTAMLWTADYMYFVAGFGNMNITDHVYWCVVHFSTGRLRPLTGTQERWRAFVNLSPPIARLCSSSLGFYCVDGEWSQIRMSM